MKGFLKVCLKLLFVGMVIWACEHLSAFGKRTIRDASERETKLAEFLKNPVLPACDSDVTKQALIDAVASTELGKVGALEILDIKDRVQDTATSVYRLCSGTFYLNNNITVQKQYNIFWIDKRKGEWSVSVNLLSE